MTDEWDTYERISDAEKGDVDGVERQRMRNRAAVEALGGVVGIEHRENNTSAYKKRKVTLTDQYGYTYEALRVIRPVWGAALNRLRTGESKRLMVWDLDRLARDVRDLEDAIEVVTHYGATIHSAIPGQIDLTNDNGIWLARQLVLAANKSSADTARRVSDKKEVNRSLGKRQGGRYRTYGYTRQWETIKEEKAIVIEAFSRRLKGESVTAIAKDFTSRGLTNVNGKPWNAGNLGKILARHDYAGLLTYKGKVVGKTNFEAFIDEATFNAVQDSMALRRKKGQGTRKHLLSGILVCTCGTTMKGNGTANHYRCPSPADVQGACGSRTAKMDITDVVIAGAAHRKSQMLDDIEPVINDRDFDGEIALIDERIKKIQSSFNAEEIEFEDAQQMLAGERAKRKAIIKEQAEVVVPEVGPVQTWLDYHDMNLSQKRLFLGRYIRYVRVHPPTKNNRLGFDKERLEVFWTDGTSERLIKKVFDTSQVRADYEKRHGHPAPFDAREAYDAQNKA